MGWGQEPHAEYLALDKLCKKGWFLPRTQGLLQLYFFSGYKRYSFLCGYREKWLWPLFSDSQNPEVLNAGKARQQKTTADLQA